MLAAMDEPNAGPETADECADVIERETTTQGPTRLARRGKCCCGWLGPWRKGRTAGWQATADADEHRNEN